MKELFKTENCPVCGSPSEILFQKKFGKFVYWTECRNTKCLYRPHMLQFPTEEAAAKDWNKIVERRKGEAKA